VVVRRIVEVIASGPDDGVMVVITVTRIVDGDGRVMMLVEVVVRVVSGGGEGWGRMPVILGKIKC